MSKEKFTLDPFTFGDSTAAMVLAERLMELQNRSLMKRVSSYLEQHNSIVNAVSTIHSRHARHSVLHLIADRVKSYNPPWPENITTYVKNVATAKIKKAKEA